MIYKVNPKVCVNIATHAHTYALKHTYIGFYLYKLYVFKAPNPYP